MAFARHNIDKRRLIDLVRQNPILWDCRLPHYKRSDKKKAIKWNELGRIFSVNGERVQRTFTSLREIFRRELNHEKLLGNRFKSKWEYYDDMAFLKEVIRERKSRERVKHDASCHHNNNSHGIDEYQYFAPNDPNNPNKQQKLQHQLQHQQLQLQKTLQLVNAVQPATSLLDQPDPNACSTSAMASVHVQSPMSAQTPQSQLQQSPLLILPALNHQPPTSQSLPQPFPIEQSPEAIVVNGNDGVASQLPPLQANIITNHQHIPHQQLQHSPSSPQAILSSTSNSSSPSICIKEEPYDSHDETISLATTTPNGQLEANLKSNSPIGPQSTMSQRKFLTALDGTKFHHRKVLQNKFSINQNRVPRKRLRSKKRDLMLPNPNMDGIENANDIADNCAIDSVMHQNCDDDMDDDVDDDIEEGGLGDVADLNEFSTIVDDMDDDDCEEVNLVLDEQLSATSTTTIHKLHPRQRQNHLNSQHRQHQQQYQQYQQHQHHQHHQHHQQRQQQHPFFMPTARELLYSKFGDFLAARLNSLQETIANDLMNKILMLIAEK